MSTEDITITKPSDLTFDILKRVSSDDATWIMLMLFLGKTWTITGDMQNNRRNVYLSMKEYWKGTYSWRRKAQATKIR
jgi:hypothetical protein